jgi:hypothetical protein
LPYQIVSNFLLPSGQRIVLCLCVCPYIGLDGSNCTTKVRTLFNQISRKLLLASVQCVVFVLRVGSYTGCCRVNCSVEVNTLRG